MNGLICNHNLTVNSSMIIYKKRCNPEDIHSHHLRRSLITNTKGVGIFLNTQIFLGKYEP